LPGVAGADISLHDFAGRKVLLVFTQAGCGPCQSIVPELNRLHHQGQLTVLVVNNGDPETTRHWAAKVGARFPVLAQEQFAISKRYQVCATPFAFLVDEHGVIASKGIAGSRQHLGYVLTGAGDRDGQGYEGSEPDETEKEESNGSISSTEVSDV